VIVGERAAAAVMVNGRRVSRMVVRGGRWVGGVNGGSVVGARSSLSRSCYVLC